MKVNPNLHADSQVPTQVWQTASSHFNHKLPTKSIAESRQTILN